MSKTILSYSQVQQFINTHNIVNGKLAQLWEMGMNKYGMNEMMLERAQCARYISFLYMGKDWNVVDWTDKNYVIAVDHILSDNKRKLKQMIVEKRFFDMSSKDMEDYLTIQSLKELNNLIIDQKIKLAAIINNAEHGNKFFDELGIDHFHHISDMFVEKKNG